MEETNQVSDSKPETLPKNPEKDDANISFTSSNSQSSKEEGLRK